MRETSFLFHYHLASAYDVNACGQPVACGGVEAVGHAAALQVIHRTVGSAVRHTVDAGGLAVEDDRELLGT